MAEVQIKINGVDWNLETDTQKIEIVSDGKIHISVVPKKPSVGDEIMVGGLKWKILEITEKGYLCLAEKLEKTMRFGENNDWKDSYIREYLNGEFYERLSEIVGAENIIPMERDLFSLDGQTEYGKCEDKVSIISIDEYRKYRPLIPNTDYYWWTLTPDSTKCNGDTTWVRVVCPSGISTTSITTSAAVCAPLYLSHLQSLNPRKNKWQRTNCK